METKNKTLVLGVGNSLRQDDGIGPEIINILRADKNKNYDVLDGGDRWAVPS